MELHPASPARSTRTGDREGRPQTDPGRTRPTRPRPHSGAARGRAAGERALPHEGPVRLPPPVTVSRAGPGRGLGHRPPGPTRLHDRQASRRPGRRERPRPAPGTSLRGRDRRLGTAATGRVEGREAAVGGVRGRRDVLVNGAMPLPPIRTVDDLRSVLSRYGFPGDRARFEEELAAAVGTCPGDDFTSAGAVVRAYR